MLTTIACLDVTPVSLRVTDAPTHELFLPKASDDGCASAY